MPNWITNNVEIKGNKTFIRILADRLKEIKENDKCLFDAFVPMPETFRKYDTTNYPDGTGLYYDTDPATIEEYKKASKEQMEQYGVVGWYDWSCKYWGTKWDVSIFSYCTIENDTTLLLSFNTVWSTPREFFESFTNAFPEYDVKVEFADEDFGNNCGIYKVQDGKVVGFEDKTGDLDFCAEVLGYDPREDEEEEEEEDEESNDD